MSSQPTGAASVSPSDIKLAERLISPVIEILRNGFDDLVSRLRDDRALAELVEQRGIDSVLRDTALLNTLRKEGGHFATPFEKQAEEYVRARLRAANPRLGFIGEETEADIASDRVAWVVMDPIDGTVEAIRAAVAAANDTRLAEPKGAFGLGFAMLDATYQPVWGTIVELDVVDGRLSTVNTFVGGQNQPTTRNGMPVSLAQPRPLADAVVATTVPAVMFNTQEQRWGFVHVVDTTAALRRGLNGVGFACLLLPDNDPRRVDVFFEADLDAADAGPVVALARGVPGLRVGDHDGRPHRFDPEARHELEQRTGYHVLAAHQATFDVVLDRYREGMTTPRDEGTLFDDAAGYREKAGTDESRPAT